MSGVQSLAVTDGRSVWILHVLPVCALDNSMFSGFQQEHDDGLGSLDTLSSQSSELTKFFFCLK